MSNGVSAAPFSVSATFALAMRGLMIEKRVRERPGVISGRVGSCDISGNLQKIVKHTAANNSGFVLDNRVYTAAKNAVRAFTLDFDGMEYTSLITGAYSSHSPRASSARCSVGRVVAACVSRNRLIGTRSGQRYGPDEVRVRHRKIRHVETVINCNGRHR